MASKEMEMNKNSNVNLNVNENVSSGRPSKAKQFVGCRLEASSVGYETNG